MNTLPNRLIIRNSSGRGVRNRSRHSWMNEIHVMQIMIRKGLQDRKLKVWGSSREKERERERVNLKIGHRSRNEKCKPILHIHSQVLTGAAERLIQPDIKSIDLCYF